MEALIWMVLRLTQDQEDFWGSTDTIVGVENVRTTSGDDIVFGSEILILL